MSLDVDWSLLSTFPEGTTSALSASLIESLNKHLSTASRPSFIGPISVTSFDFGSSGPDVEITDIRDVWRAFDEGDEEGDEELEVERSFEYEYQSGQVSEAGGARGEGGGGGSRRRIGRYLPPTSPLDDEAYDVISPIEARQYLSPTDEEPLDDMSIYSGLSPRNSVAAVGIGIGGGAMSFGIGRDYASAIMSPGPGGLNPSLFSAPMSSRLHPHLHPPPTHAPSHQHGHGHSHHRTSRNATGSHAHAPRRIHRRSPLSTPPPSPPARPAGLPDTPSSSIPSLQLHVHISHASNLQLTLLTSLQVNYPSPLFMSLPLKLSVTGLTLAADLIVAYSGAKHRLHLCIVDEDPDGNARKGDSDGHHVPIGQRLLPNLQIESEIGHADAHVLRNVGKVERFIADAVRKTLVDELVFPNFHTIAL
ncbi:Mitochondrial inheritance component MDM12 [Saitozyma sp. JCM 24511]|nr:Mitochondrial inheritance component MDM12 [Saitozyma sp. JCM 24511]